jgi:hypothetical protein
LLTIFTAKHQAFFWGIMLVLITHKAAAVDSTKVTGITPPTTSTCSDYYFDVFAGTIPPSTLALPVGQYLDFYNNGSTSSQSPTLKCTGVYSIVMNLVMQASLLQAIRGLVYLTYDITKPALLFSFTFDPYCGYTGTAIPPYCSVEEFTFSTQVSVKQDGYISAPLYDGSQAILVGGYLEYTFLHS